MSLAKWARAAKERHSGRQVFYTVNRHINLTNICASGCPLCAFQVPEEDAARRGFLLSPADLDKEIAAANADKAAIDRIKLQMDHMSLADLKLLSQKLHKGKYQFG